MVQIIVILFRKKKEKGKGERKKNTDVTFYTEMSEFDGFFKCVYSLSFLKIRMLENKEIASN